MNGVAKWVDMELGKTAMAFDALNNAGRFSERNSKSLPFRGYLLARVGRADEARDVLKTLAAVYGLLASVPEVGFRVANQLSVWIVA